MTEQPTAKANKKNNRRGGIRRIRNLVPNIARKAFRQYGFPQSQIILRWRDVMGPVMARNTEPVRLYFPKGKRTGATLHLRANSGFALELQHLEPLIIEKINGFFGYAAVEKLAIMQGPVRAHEKKTDKKITPLSVSETEELESTLKNTHDADLKAALHGLGSDILSEAAVGKDKNKGVKQ